MTVTVARRADIGMDSFARAAWEGEDVVVAADALAEVARRREQFLAFVAANPERKLYGINVHAGEGSDRLLSAEEQRDYARGLHSGTSFGEPLPRRVVRGIAFARLANFVEGHSAVSAELVEVVAARLDGRELPPVPRYGNGGAGEIQALGWLFDDVGRDGRARRQGRNGADQRLAVRAGAARRCGAVRRADDRRRGVSDVPGRGRAGRRVVDVRSPAGRAVGGSRVSPGPLK